MKKIYIITNRTNVDPTSLDNVAAGYALAQEWYNELTGDKFYHKEDGVWNKYEKSAVLGLIKIVDKAGDFFTDLATAGDYIRTFTTATITDESFSNGTYWFTVPNGSSFGLASGFLALGSPLFVNAYIEDPLGLITTFGSYSFEYNNGNNVLGNATFPATSFEQAGGINTFGNCTFGAGAFSLASGINKFKNILLVNSTDAFAEQSTGRFEIYGNIGTDETAEYTNFFLDSTAVIWAHKSKETSNAGGIEGDLLTAQANGAKLFFGYIDKELIEVTYTELLALKTGSLLIPGQIYLLTDYETVYEQPQSFETISSGVTEQLYITATYINELHNVCKSDLYPNDIVYYEITGDTGDSYGTEGFTKGKIYRRIDTIGNNDIGTDWRHIKYRRWALNVNNPWVIHNSYVKGDIVNDGNNIYICVNDVLDSLTLFNDWFLYPAINGEYASIFSTGNTLRLLGNNYTIPVDSLDYQDSYMFSLDFTDTENFCNNKIETYYLNNNVILSSSFHNNNIGGRFVNNYIKDYQFSSNDIVYTFIANIINDEMYYNNIMSPFVENIVNQTFASNNIQGYETFGNVFNGIFRDNNIDRMYYNYLNSFYNNNINGIFGLNSFQGGFIGNLVDAGGSIEYCKSFNASGIYNNFFNAYFRYNDINGDFRDNTLKGLIDTNTFQDQFRYNNISGETFMNNNIGIYFIENKIDGVFDDNIIGDYFKSNKIGTYFTNNIIGDSFGSRFLLGFYEEVGNTIGSYFRYNTTSGEFSGNTIGTHCGYFNDGLGGSTMSGNNFGTGFINNLVGDNIIELDFTSYTELYNKEYKHEIYRLPDNTLQYKWRDNFGDINIEKIV